MGRGDNKRRLTTDNELLLVNTCLFQLVCIWASERLWFPFLSNFLLNSQGFVFVLSLDRRYWVFLFTFVPTNVLNLFRISSSLFSAFNYNFLQDGHMFPPLKLLTSFLLRNSGAALTCIFRNIFVFSRTELRFYFEI